ncbi:flagellar basal body P-ring formation chaperone FlgA [Photobacterium sp.]|uniref:flagellar basal body P-ring formation chaperone FlgA n=1 Tax=Photobacterium sp. TaxID=660 RepID=UPI00299DFFE3|nr:flagellar basal body P-ring formation chaperone FlgA [Photobacterium sp.]MDX1302379.1 flagellar basal body P-ring formation chaperone FlgA [Photobacterium sp.]
MSQRTHLKLFKLIFGLLPIFFSTILFAAPQTVLETVRSAAEDHVSQIIPIPANGQLKITASPLDSRLRLSQCSALLESSIPGKQSLSGNITVLVRCSPENWQVYVPVNVQLLLPRVVAAKPLPRGSLLTASHLNVMLVESRFQRGIVFEHPYQIIGSTVKRAVNMGEAVQGGDICLVCRNDTVMIKANGGGLNIVTKGNALTDGSLGEQVRVQNSQSKRIIDGIITGVGEVTVNF